jgi:uncharacterized protein YdaU (DUF1376 family)
MGRLRYHHCYHEDFLVGTAGLSDEQFAAYVRIIWTLYSREGRLKNDPHQLRMLLNMRSVRPVKRVVMDLVSLGKLRLDEDGFLGNDRVDYELTRRKKFDQSLGANSSETLPKLNGNLGQTPPEKPTNTTRAHAPAHAGGPDTRNHIRESSLSNGANTAREPETLSQVLARRLADARREEQATENGPDETSKQD